MGEPATIRVALLDDDNQFRRRLVQRLGFVPWIQVVTESASPSEFRAKLDSLAPAVDVALVDIGLPGTSGIAVADRLSTDHPSLGILMLTVFEDDANVLQAIQAGASGYLLKDTPVDVLAAAVREVHAGGVPLSRSIARRILNLAGGRRAPIPTQGAGRNPLSQRETELLKHVVEGATEAVIAERLGISPHTVRTHVKNIYRKLRVRSRAAAVRLVLQRGFVEPHRP